MIEFDVEALIYSSSITAFPLGLVVEGRSLVIKHLEPLYVSEIMLRCGSCFATSPHGSNHCVHCNASFVDLSCDSKSGVREVRIAVRNTIVVDAVQEKLLGPRCEQLKRASGSRGLAGDIIPFRKTVAPGHADDMGLKTFAKGSVSNTMFGSGLDAGNKDFDNGDWLCRKLRGATDHGCDATKPLEYRYRSSSLGVAHYRDTINNMFPNVNSQKCSILDPFAYQAYTTSCFRYIKHAETDCRVRMCCGIHHVSCAPT